MDIQYHIKPRVIRAPKKHQFASDLREIAVPLFRQSGSTMSVGKIEMATAIDGYTLEDLPDCTLVFECHQWLDTISPDYPPSWDWLQLLGQWVRLWGPFEEGRVKIMIRDIGYSEVVV